MEGKRTEGSSVDDNGQPLPSFLGSPTRRQSNLTQAGFNLFKIFVGNGILVFPFLFHHVGWALAMLSIVLVGALSFYCMFLVLTAADKLGRSSMTIYKMAAITKGPRYESIIMLLVVGSQSAIAVGYIVFVRDFIRHIVCANGLTTLCSSDEVPLLVALAFILPMSLITNFHYFSYSSVIAVILQLIVFATLSFVNIQRLSEEKTERTPMTTWNLLGLTHFLGNIIFKYEGVPVLLDVRSSMQTPERLRRLLTYVAVVISGLYLVFPVLAYAVLRDSVLNIVLLNYPLDQPLFLGLTLAYTVVTLLGFPLQFFPILDALQKVRRGHPLAERILHHRSFFRLALVLAFGLIAYHIKGVEKLFHLAGVLFAGPISFLLPIQMYDALFHSQLSRGRLYLHKGLFWTLAILLSTLIVTSFYKLIFP